MSTNPFETTERWETSLDTLLDVGNHVVTIAEAEDDTANSGNPQIVLRFENPSGSIRAWETYHSEFLRKVASLYDSAGVQGPQEGEFDPEDHCRISDSARRRLVGTKVGIVVREEEDNRPDHAGEKRKRVQGYVEPSKITGGPDTRGLPGDPGTVASSPAPDDKIPF